MAKAAMGVLVSDGGNGVFPADIICVGNVNIVVANPGCGGIKYDGYPRATHEIAEFPGRVYSNKPRGFFVVPAEQLVEVGPGEE